MNAAGKLQTACTRTRIVRSADPSSSESTAVIATLQAWLLEGPRHENKSSHQKLKDASIASSSAETSATAAPKAKRASASKK
eukprot:1004448-Amphidinium_carterae.1